MAEAEKPQEPLTQLTQNYPETLSTLNNSTDEGPECLAQLTQDYPETNNINQSTDNKETSSMSMKNSENAAESEADRFLTLEELNISPESLIKVKKTKQHMICRTPDGHYGMKICRSKSSSTKNVTHLTQENEILKLVQHHGLRTLIGRTICRNRQALVFEWFDGSTISQIIESKVFSTMDFLIIAKEITSALISMHKQSIVHLNLNCDHVLIKETASGPCVKIIGYSLSSNHQSENNYISNNNLFEHDLRCISPEQTGRVHRNVGFRSDFYSLGTIFYVLLTKKYPFESENVLKLIHLHILQDAPSINTLNPEIPSVISDMVSKLMSKNPEDRYQSAKGILHDLYMMTSEYEADQSLESVKLQEHDISDTPFIPQILYGRSEECNTLTSVFNETISNSFRAVFVIGSSGVGKSHLVQELYRPVVMKNGIFTCGKYDYAKSEPYGALIQAVNNICNNVLLESKDIIDQYRVLMQNAVGEEGKLLTDVIPSLQSIIGTQPHLSDAFGNEAKNRFRYVFIKFIKAICSSERPLVLLLEDLHWIDLASFDLLSSIINEGIKKLMLVGVYRDDEVDDSHFVTQLLQKMRDLNVSMTEIKLNNMNCETINEMISDTLSLPPLNTYSLSSLVYEKTKGSPYFVYQMLTSLFEQNLITFCNEKSKWEWDESSLINKSMAENVRELLKNKVLSFNSDTIQALKIACCLGSPFSLPTLRIILNCTKGIEGAKKTGMITQCEGSHTSYRFAHDQIQQVVHDLLPVVNKNKLYLYIGTKMWTHIPKNDLDENLFTIVNLLQHTLDMVKEREKRIKMVDLFMQAGKKAMSSTAFKQALHYLDTAIRLLNSDCWETKFHLTLQLHNLAAKMAYSAFNYRKMDKLLNTITSHVTSSIQLAQTYSLKIRVHNDKREFAEAIRVGLSSLNKLGEHIREANSGAIIGAEIKLAKDLMGEISDDAILALKEMTHEPSLSIMMILNDMISSCYFSNPQLLPVITSRMIRLTIKQGVSKYSAVGFSYFGVILCTKNDHSAYRYGNLAISLLSKVQAKELIPKTLIVFYITINPCFASVHTSLGPIIKMYEMSLEVGSLEYSVHCSNAYILCAFYTGMVLRKFADDLESLHEQLAYKTFLFQCMSQIVLNLLDERTENENHGYLRGKLFDYQGCFERSADGSTTRASVVCCSIAYLFHDYALAQRFLDMCRRGIGDIRTSYLYPMFIFYDGLVSLWFAKQSEAKEKWLKSAADCIQTLRHMSETAPENLLNKLCLLEAEKAAICNEAQILEKYKEAITLSSKNNFPQEEGLACEKAAIFFIEQNSTEIASTFLTQAFYSYHRWGAIAKLKHLRGKYETYLTDLNKPASGLPNMIDKDMKLDETSHGAVSFLTISTCKSFCASNENKRRRTNEE